MKIFVALHLNYWNSEVDVGNENIKDLMYANDINLFAEISEVLLYLMDRLDDYCNMWDLDE